MTWRVLQHLSVSATKPKRRSARIVGRPALIGHVGEFIASRIFRIELERVANARGFDGRFADGSLAGKTVNVKWYAKLEGMLDIRPDALPDYFLVLAVPPGRSYHVARREALVIESVYLFEAMPLVQSLEQRGVKIGIPTSLAKAFWLDAEIHPEQHNEALVLTQEQRELLRLFSLGEEL